MPWVGCHLVCRETVLGDHIHAATSSTQASHQLHMAVLGSQVKRGGSILVRSGEDTESLNILTPLGALNNDVRCSKLLSYSASHDFCKSSVSIRQKKAIGELYRATPFSSCTFTVCGSYAHFYFFLYKLPLNKNAKVLRLYCTDS